MTLAQAVEILNREKHRGYNRWWTRQNPRPDECRTAEGSPEDWLTEFEAIAVAEKYEARRSISDLEGFRRTLDKYAPPGD